MIAPTRILGTVLDVELAARSARNIKIPTITMIISMATSLPPIPVVKALEVNSITFWIATFSSEQIYYTITKYIYTSNYCQEVSCEECN